MQMQIKRLRPEAILPTRGSAQAAGYDLYACLDGGEVVLQPGETRRISLGYALALPEGYFGAVFARSGLSTKQGLRPANCVGVVDSDYRGELTVFLTCHKEQGYTVRPGERIAQMVILPVAMAEPVEVEELDETLRGEGGFGSTGAE